MRETRGDVEAIIFDIGGTLRERVADEPFQQRATEQLLKLLGKPDAPPDYLDELARRYAAYSEWAQERLIELPEAEIWTRWVVPDLPREQVAPHAIELTMLWRNHWGRAVPRADARPVIAELHARGYRLGVISNTTSSVDAPQSLEEYGLKPYFDIIILSATVGRRKPAPEIFWQATRALGIAPARCAYVGDRISRDVVGARRAGLACAILIEARGSHTEPRDGAAPPDAIIHSLSELLEIFPARRESGNRGKVGS